MASALPRTLLGLHTQLSQLNSACFTAAGTTQNVLFDKPQLAAGCSDESLTLHTFGCQQTEKESRVDVSGQCLPFLLHL